MKSIIINIIIESNKTKILLGSYIMWIKKLSAFKNCKHSLISYEIKIKIKSMKVLDGLNLSVFITKYIS